MNGKYKIGSSRYYYGWNIVAVTALSQAASFGIAINCLSLYIPYWSRDLAAPASLLTICYTVNGGGYALLAPLAGVVADKRSVRFMMTAGLLGVALLFALASQVQHAWQLLGLFAVLAPASMVVAGHLPSTVLVSRWFERRRGLAIGFSTMGQTIAGAVLPPVLGILLPLVGWRPTFLIISGFIAFVCAPIVLLILRDRPSEEHRHETEFNITQATGATNAPAKSVQEILKNRNFWILLIVSVLGGFMSAGISVNIAPLMLSRGFTVAEAGTLIAALSLGALGYKLMAGYAIDRLNGGLVLALVVITGIAGVIVVRLGASYPMLLLGVLLVAGCAGLGVPIATLVAREFGAASFGRAMGMILLGSVVAVFAPPVVAFIRESTGDYDVPLVILAAGGVIALVATIFFQDSRDVRKAGAPAKI